MLHQAVALFVVLEGDLAFAQVGTDQAGGTEVRPAQAGAAQVGAVETGKAQIGIAQVGAEQVGADENGVTQGRTVEPRARQDSVAEIDPLELHFGQVDIAEIGEAPTGFLGFEQRVLLQDMAQGRRIDRLQGCSGHLSRRARPVLLHRSVNGICVTVYVRMCEQ